MGIRTIIRKWLKVESKIIPPQILSIGTGSYFSTIHSFFDAKLKIGNYSSIGAPLFVHGASEHLWVKNPKMVSTYPFGTDGTRDDTKGFSKGQIIIGSDVWIGRNVTILSGVKINDGAIIGTEAVVAKDIPAYAIAVGNPAKIIRYRYSPEIIQKLLKIKWWNWPKEKIVANLEYFNNIDLFLKKFSKP